MGLFEELSQKFPIQVVEPLGPVITIPVREFKNEWREPLEREGCKILLSDYLGKSCFLVRKLQPSNNSMGSNPSLMEQKQIEEPKPKLQGRVDEKQIVECIQQGLNFKQIRDKLGLSHAELMGHLSSLKKKGILDKVGWISTRRRKQRQQKDTQNFAESLTVKELLQASLKLIEEHPRIVKILLEKAEQML